MPKFADVDDFYASLPEDQERSIRQLVDHVADAHPELEPVLAWNQPMFKLGKDYLIGFMPTKKHINLLTVTDSTVTELGSRLEGYKHGTRSIARPLGSPIDADLIANVIALRKVELGL